MRFNYVAMTYTLEISAVLILGGCQTKEVLPVGTGTKRYSSAGNERNAERPDGSYSEPKPRHPPEPFAAPRCHL